ncbi:MAG: bifunctional methylenetetrahydrofolate dehydrogenase/methenyltetrahydrofolate cyclohydrolase FolD [Candidatus Puniceispirillum sp.]|jgi:methylenetetrahydrofolate dehydrogenase (NADP+)/methenyltetrahydrofolate cyclohydrolase|uniref:bifunctional methylenetetrahydrofolate dehydrogenase/methenyltetrahydrofolate cyclohydrolase FolD n=1 Tax=Candidatus Puniceispirillum sp. TaxID=2026719 RepID=UPI001ED76F21|nr:bifunctional methylenetetrahydrofolate dehydrogenase/methenyltetrahydrofolate cyclohydrolase FolD [Candidatus Puniceispirillum sp.]MBT6414838.1 bifunctional methylenetetrahydrofolate dehydrogenase/methenyltetrahydrofolate cyclohydrolase FolD [Candidatus Puniceispirillum sp.]MBT6565943.1 bifunctional methylenetetrahydrofolate dehydrogenase/methenyltetrahydrofolate cyclohydrolase FolD [Candidatus Puniceispirillum sp.]
METKIIDGKAFSEKLVEAVAVEASKIKAAIGRPPALAVVLVGENSASKVYVRNKIERTEAAGMRSIEHKLDVNTDQATLLALIEEMNNDDAVDGILVQLPLPDQIDEDAVINAVAPEKDVDGFHVVNAGLLATGQDSLVPCTPYGCLLLLRDQLGSLSGLNAVVVGRSNIVGKPMAQLLLKESCTVTIAHSRTKDLKEVCARADILVAAVGRAEMIDGDYVKQGATVIDVGINRVAAPERGEGKFRLTGDVDYDSAAAKAGAITPVPGGVGPMTIACLLRNTAVAAARRFNVEIADI